MYYSDTRQLHAQRIRKTQDRFDLILFIRALLDCADEIMSVFEETSAHDAAEWITAMDEGQRMNKQMRA